MLHPIHFPILNIQEETFHRDPNGNDDVVVHTLDYQPAINLIEAVAKFLQMLQQVQNDLVEFKKDEPTTYQELEELPFFEMDYCRKRTQVRNYASDIIGLACRETVVPKIAYTGIESVNLSQSELLVATCYEFHAYMHDFFLTPLNAIEDLLDPDGIRHEHNLPPLSQQHVTRLEELRSKLKPAFKFCQDFCDNNESEFKKIVYGDANFDLYKECGYEDDDEQMDEGE